MILAQVAQVATVAAGPWWGTAIIAGIATLAGGLITVSVQSIIEWRKGRREHHRRWEDQTLQVSLKFLDVMELMAPHSRYHPNDLEAVRRTTFDGAEAMKQAEDHLRHLRIVAPRMLYDRASNLSYAAFAFMVEPLDDKRWNSQVYKDLRDAYDEFFTEIKGNLRTRKGRGMKKSEKLINMRGSVGGQTPTISTPT